jgi:hypothetical protein
MSGTLDQRRRWWRDQMTRRRAAARAEHICSVCTVRWTGDVIGVHAYGANDRRGHEMDRRRDHGGGDRDGLVGQSRLEAPHRHDESTLAERARDEAMEVSPPTRALTHVIVWRAGGYLEIYGDFDRDQLDADERQLVTTITEALAAFATATDQRRGVHAWQRSGS